MSETTFKSVMGELAEAFMEDTRGDGSKFVRLRDGHPEWMRDAVRAAHDGSAPNDRHYKAARDVAEYLSGCDFGVSDDDFADYDPDVCEACASAAESLTDVYTSHLISWLAETPGALDACDEVAEEGVVAPESDLETRIRSGQWRWYEKIGQALCAAVVAQVNAGREAEVSK